MNIPTEDLVNKKNILANLNHPIFFKLNDHAIGHLVDAFLLDVVFFTIFLD